MPSPQQYLTRAAKAYYKKKGYWPTHWEHADQIKHLWEKKEPYIAPTGNERILQRLSIQRDPADTTLAYPGSPLARADTTRAREIGGMPPLAMTEADSIRTGLKARVSKPSPKEFAIKKLIDRGEITPARGDSLLAGIPRERQEKPETAPQRLSRLKAERGIKELKKEPTGVLSPADSLGIEKKAAEKRYAKTFEPEKEPTYEQALKGKTSALAGKKRIDEVDIVTQFFAANPIVIKAGLSVNDEIPQDIKDELEASYDAQISYYDRFISKYEDKKFVNKLNNKYPPSEHKGATGTDKDTGKRYMSDGKQWREITQ